MLTQDENLQTLQEKSNLEETHIKLHDQRNQLCRGKAIFVKVLYLKAEELKYSFSYCSLW